MKPFLSPFYWILLSISFLACQKETGKEQSVFSPEVEQGSCLDLLNRKEYQAAQECLENRFPSGDTSHKLPQRLEHFTQLGESYLGTGNLSKVEEIIFQIDSLMNQEIGMIDSLIVWKYLFLKSKYHSRKGFELSSQDNMDEGVEAYHKAEEGFYGLLSSWDKGNFIGEKDKVYLYDELGTYYSFLGFPDSALIYNKKALSTIQKADLEESELEINLLEVISYIYDYEVEWDSAMKFNTLLVEKLKQSSEGDTSLKMIESFLFRTRCFNNQHNYDSAIYYLDGSQNYLQQLTHEETPVTKHLLYFLYGETYSGYGDFSRAIDAYEQSTRYVSEDFARDRKADALEKIGPLYLKIGDYQQTIHLIEESLSIRDFESPIPDIQQRIADSYLDKSTAYLKLNQLDFSKKSLDSAKWVIDRMEVVSRLTEKYRAKLHQAHGELALKEGNFFRAKEESEIAINLYESLFGAKYGELGECYITLSRQAGKKNDWDASLNYAQSALSSVLIHPSTADSSKILGNEEDLVLSYSVLAQAYDQIAKVFIEQHAQSGDISFLYNALSQYRKADEYLSSNMSHLATESSILAFRNSWYFLYEEAIKTSIRLWKAAPDSHALDTAYQYAEKSKAHVLRQSQQDFLAKSEAGINSHSWELERRYKQELAYARTAFLNARSEDLPELDNQLFQAKEAYITYVEELEERYPKYYELKYKLPISSVPKVQATLSPTQAFIQYVEGDSSLYQFVITSDSSWMRTLRISPSFVTAVDSLQRIISIDPTGEMGVGLDSAWSLYKKYGFQVYKELYLPIINDLGDKTDIKIVPDGILMKVPTSALLTRAEFEDPYDPPFFIHEVTVSYDFSGTTHVAGNGNSSSEPLEILGVTPDFSQVDLVDLVRTPEGLRKIEKLVAGKFLKDRQATKAHVDKYLPEYGILYFATHAEMDTTSPLFSNLAFTPTSPPVMDKERDFLYAYELYNYSLKAQLTILGACETGIGAYERSEGMISLGRAFAYAGCPSLVMSLWKAQDIPSSLNILPSFVENLTERQDKAHALRKAKMEFLAESKKNKWEKDLFPYAWATFISVGNQSPLELAKPVHPMQNLDWVYRGIFVLLVLFIGRYILRRRKSHR